MSIVLITKKEFSDVAKSIEFYSFLRETFFSWRERYYKQKFNDEEVSRNNILCFCERLYLANRMAFYYQYYDECKDKRFITIERLDESDFKDGNILNERDLLKLLRLIHYNLYTNAGYCFLGQEDMERLERLIERLKDRILDGW